MSFMKRDIEIFRSREKSWQKNDKSTSLDYQTNKKENIIGVKEALST